MLIGVDAIDIDDLENGLNEFQVKEVLRCMKVTELIEKEVQIPTVNDSWRIMKSILDEAQQKQDNVFPK